MTYELEQNLDTLPFEIIPKVELSTDMVVVVKLKIKANFASKSLKAIGI